MTREETLALLLATVLPIPLLFAALLIAFPALLGMPAPWWAWAGVGFCAALGTGVAAGWVRG